MKNIINKLRKRVFRKKVTYTMVLLNKEELTRQIVQINEKLKEAKSLANEIASIELKVSTHNATQSSSQNQK